MLANAQMVPAQSPTLGHERGHRRREDTMSLGTIVLIVLVLMLLGAIPAWPHSRNWGYGPSGGLGLLVVVLLILVLLGRI
jgi:Zn-dependent protease with chaperone function